MRVLIGIAAALGLAVVIMGLLLKTAWSDRDAAVQAQQALADDLKRSEQVSKDTEHRFDQLDKSISELNQALRANETKLAGLITGIENIQQTENDSDETISCLGTPVPAQLDDLLRQ